MKAQTNTNKRHPTPESKAKSMKIFTKIMRKNNWHLYMSARYMRRVLNEIRETNAYTGA